MFELFLDSQAKFSNCAASGQDGWFPSDVFIMKFLLEEKSGAKHEM